MKKLVYISDFFVEEIAGGAEINDSILLDYISKDHKVVKLHSKEVTSKHINLYLKSGFKFLISNFVLLNIEALRAFIDNPKSYSIIEHDHKYLKHRNPSIYKGFLAPSLPNVAPLYILLINGNAAPIEFSAMSSILFIINLGKGSITVKLFFNSFA